MSKVAQEVTCPSCAKVNPISGASGVCTRCQCDLEVLRRIAIAANDHLRSALRCLKRGDWENALVHAEESWALKHDSEAAAVAYLASTALGDFDAGADWLDSSRSLEACETLALETLALGAWNDSTSASTFIS